MALLSYLGKRDLDWTLNYVLTQDFRRWALLSVLAPHLNAEQLNKALSFARTLDNEFERAEAFAALVPHISVANGQIASSEVLAACIAIVHSSTDRTALTVLAPLLTMSQL